MLILLADIIKATGLAAALEEIARNVREQLTDAEITNLRTACLTSTMRNKPEWQTGLDALAVKLDRMRPEQGQ